MNGFVAFLANRDLFSNKGSYVFIETVESFTLTPTALKEIFELLCCGLTPTTKEIFDLLWKLVFPKEKKEIFDLQNSKKGN